MGNTQSQTIKNAEAKRFDDNASRILVGWGEDSIIGLFASLGYECQPKGDGTYRMPCPLCEASFVFIGTGGDHHPVYWKCLSGKCRDDAKKFVKNLLGLVRACVEGESLGAA